MKQTFFFHKLMSRVEEFKNSTLVLRTFWTCRIRNFLRQRDYFLPTLIRVKFSLRHSALIKPSKKRKQALRMSLAKASNDGIKQENSDLNFNFVGNFEARKNCEKDGKCVIMFSDSYETSNVSDTMSYKNRNQANARERCRTYRYWFSTRRKEFIWGSLSMKWSWRWFSIHTTFTYFNLMKFNCERSHPTLTYYPHDNDDFAPQLPKFA